MKNEKRQWVECSECGLPQPKDPELSLHYMDCSKRERLHDLIHLLGMGITDERITYLKRNYFDPPILTLPISERQ